MIRRVASQQARHLSPKPTMKPSPAVNNGSNNKKDGGYTAEEYVRNPDHIPQTGQDESEKYILALHTDPAHHKTVTALRTKHFPVKINKLTAHVSLFRALPGSQLPAIEAAIKKLVQHQDPFQISTGEPFLMPYGVGLAVHAGAAASIYQILKEQWTGFLSKQDQSFRPHYTIQNKVERSTAQRTVEDIHSGPGRFEGSTGTVTGLSLFLYDRGYWTLKQTYPFSMETRDQKIRVVVVDKSDKEEWPSLGASK
ncbi:MAG: hypothetical protein Q9169_007889 [Polycauliona sp. 2 TL-2023]